MFERAAAQHVQTLILDFIKSKQPDRSVGE
jgi:hypothetical protein